MLFELVVGGENDGIGEPSRNGASQKVNYKLEIKENSYNYSEDSVRYNSGWPLSALQIKKETLLRNMIL